MLWGAQEMACNNEIFIYSTHILDVAKRACMWKPIKCFSEIKAADKKKGKKMKTRRPPLICDVLRFDVGRETN